MRKLIILALAAAAVAASIAAVASAAPGATTHAITLSAATDGVVDLPALNSQFTKMTIKVNDGSAKWGDGFHTSYANGDTSTNRDLVSGYWGDTSLPGHGALLLEGTQVGAVIYRVDGGQWKEVTAATTIAPTDSSTHNVQVAYNDRPGSYDDDSGSLSLTVDRTKASVYERGTPTLAGYPPPRIEASLRAIDRLLH
jgi:hypothetical protein